MGGGQKAHPFTPSPLHPFIFKGIAHVHEHVTNDENDVAQAASLRHLADIFGGGDYGTSCRR